MRFGLLTLLLVVAAGTHVPAVEIQVDYSGTISAVADSLSNTFSAGDVFSGTYVFESTTAAEPGAPAGFAVYNALLSGSFEIDTQLENVIQLEFNPTSPDPQGQAIQVDDSTTFQGSPPEDRYGYVNRVSEGLTPLIRPASGAGGSVSAELESIGFSLLGGPNLSIFTDVSLPTAVELSDFQRNIFLLVFEVQTEPQGGGGNGIVVDAVLGSINSITFTPVPAAGDFNADGSVDAADYTTWRDGLGVDYTQADYQIWRNNYGQQTSLAVTPTGAPAPAAAPLAAAMAAVLAWPRRRSAIAS